MTSQNAPRGSQQQQPGATDEASAAKIRTLFRIFSLVILGSFFVLQLDITYVWLSAILTAAALVLGIVLLVRATTIKSSRRVLIAAIVAVVVSALQVLLVLTSVLFYSQLRDFQECSRQALTQQAISRCQTTLQGSLPVAAR
ncbi:MAG: hypothetical protein ABIO34_01395 [Arthrobacter oryzae]